jgi:arylsulfatase A-like enzyme
VSANEPGFGGRIGRTVADSEPWWPPLPDGLGGTNVVMVVLDDVGFAQFGCYGSELATPTIDRLAAGGLRSTGFHTTALCSPTRACLLSGRNHHAVGMRGVSNWNTGFPHMRGGITPKAATIAELLRDHGYATYAAGKWHLAPMEECSAAGPHTNWPLQKGFDRFYGFLQGETDQFHPELTSDNGPVDPPSRPPKANGDAGYHVSEDIVDRSIGWIGDLQAVRPDRPFFLYLAFGAMHAPHQAPASYLERWKGRFDEGYDVVRQRWFERQLAMGIAPPGTTLPPPNPGVPAWTDLTDNQRRFSARLMEAFAAFMEHTDDQLARLVGFLEQRALLDDTLLLVLSDNGASREGGPHGVMDEFSFFNGMWEDIDQLVDERLDDIGGPHSHSNYPWGWAQAGNSPLRWYKQNTYGGGVRDPLVVHWPGRIPDPGAVRPQFCHAVDVAATILDAAGIEPPATYKGVDQLPMAGTSLLPLLADPASPPLRAVQYFEQMGHRGIWADGWKATAYHEPGRDFDDDEWGLFHLDEDFSESHDLASSHPETLARLQQLWWAEAGANGVLPLDDRTIELFGAPPRAGSPHALGGTYTYVPPMAHMPADTAPQLGGRNWTVTAAVVIDDDGDGPVEGVLYARGNHNIGHSFFVQGGELHFDYNALGTHFRARGPVSLAPGRHELEARFDRDGKGGLLVVAADGEDVGWTAIPKVVRMLGSTGLDIGRDALSPVVDAYEAPFPFTATIEQVTFHIRSRASASDVEAHARTELAKE